MKKILIVLTICLLFTGCSLMPRNKVIISNNASNKIETYYGTFNIPDTWIKRDDHSTSRKFFFANKNDKNSVPNNISVEMGTNKYSKEDHIDFKNAIQNQLAYQVKRSGATIKGSGSTTKNGYVVYTFRVDFGSQITVQHYIVGDYKYVLVHETIWDGNAEDTDNAAKVIVNTFEWKK